MSSLTLANPKELIVGHLQVLRLYARQVMLQGGSLTSDEEDDKAERMRELAGICSSFGLTGKETVGLDSFVERPVRDRPWSARVSGREAPRAVGC